MNIEFPVFVSGIPMTASIVADESDGTEKVFRVRFSDGYEDVFYLAGGFIEPGKTEDEVKGQNIEASKPYALSLNNDLRIVTGIDTERFWYTFQEVIGDKPTNIWVMEEEEEDDDENTYSSYNVYYNNYYRFHLFNVANNWQVASKKSDVIDMVLAKKVEHLLNTVLE